MTKEQSGKIISALVVFVLAVLAAFWYDVAVVQPREAARAADAGGEPEPLLTMRAGTGYNTACYWEQGGAKITCDTGGTVEINSGGALDVASGAIVTLGDFAFEAGTFTPTAGQTLTAEYPAYIVNSSGAISMTLAAPTAAGQVLLLIGDDANTVTINDSNIRSTDGNAVTFGQYDVVVFVSSATEWLHWGKSANQ